jgi:hypothetical protein
VVRKGVVLLDPKVSIDESGQNLSETLQEGQQLEIFISAQFPTQPVIHNMRRDYVMLEGEEAIKTHEMQKMHKVKEKR